MSKTIEEHVLKEFKVIHLMGSGAYGHVWKVEQYQTGKTFALKKIFDAFRNSTDAQRTYRQIQVLHQLDHENIVKMQRVIKAHNKKDLYLLFQFMEADLHSLIGSNILEFPHQIYIFYQLLKGLKYLHCSQLIHRDLKPSNILIDSQCKIKLCDFGLVRSLANLDNDDLILSEEVATKWYRSPQLLLGSRKYGKPTDLWSLGCIIAEMLIGKPLFAGNSTLNQLEKVIQFTGELPKTHIEALDSPIAECLIHQIKVKKRPFKQYFQNVIPQFFPLIKGLLAFNPKERMTVDEALSLNIFERFRSQINTLKDKQITVIPAINDNVKLTTSKYRERIYAHIQTTHIQRKFIKRKSMGEIDCMIKSSVSNSRNHTLQRKMDYQKRLTTDIKKRLSKSTFLSPTNKKKFSSTNSLKNKQKSKQTNIFSSPNPTKSRSNSKPYILKKRKTSEQKLVNITSPKFAMSPKEILKKFCKKQIFYNEKSSNLTKSLKTSLFLKQQKEKVCLLKKDKSRGSKKLFK